MTWQDKRSPWGSSADSASWNLPRTVIAARLARRQLAGALPDLPTDRVQIAQMLTSELVTNAVKHGQGRITLSVERDEDVLTVRVADQGVQAPVKRDHDVTALGGRGLRLVDALSRRWGTERVGGARGKVVWFSMDTATRRG